jgi:antitoxin VapB
MVEYKRISTMGLNIKNAEVEKLAAEVAALAHETKTEAIRQALLQRRIRLQAGTGRGGDLRAWLEQNVWPFNPPAEKGRVLTREEEDDILGYGPEGY